MFISDSLSYSVIERTSNEAFQALFIEIDFRKQKNMICGIIYRQHNSPEHFLTYFEETLEKLASTDKRICLMADYNLCLLKSEVCEFSHNFLLSPQSCCLVPTIDKPTQIRNYCSSLIDNILVNNPDQVSISGNIISDISDHFSQFCFFKSGKERALPVKTKIRDFSHFSESSFLHDLQQVDWDSFVAHDNDINKTFTTFYNRFNKIVNKHAPIKIISH